jgi:hypothetical protein
MAHAGIARERMNEPRSAACVDIAKSLTLDPLFAICSHRGGCARKANLQRSTSMVYAMDTLGYSKRLRDAGIPQQEAEAHAEAARDFIMAELVTKTDLQTNLQVLKTELKADIQALKSDLEAKIVGVKTDLEAKLQAVEARLERKIDGQTAKLGGIVAAGVAILATLIKVF